MNERVCDLRNKISDMVSKVRSIERLVNSQLFELAYQDATKEERLQIEILLSDYQSNLLKILVHKILKTEFLGIRELRNIASDYEIKNWSRMTKEELIFNIKAKELKNEQRRVNS